MDAERAARAATTDPGSLVEQSQQVRAEVEDLYDEKKREFDDKLVQVNLFFIAKFVETPSDMACLIKSSFPKACQLLSKSSSSLALNF